MATSGVTTYQITRDQLTTEALSTLGVIAQGQVPSSDDLTKAALKLNMLFSILRTLGLPLWKRTEYSFNPVVNTQSYLIGSGQTFNTPYPLKVLQAFRVDSSGGAKIQMDIESRENFNLMPTNSSGTPIKLNYQPYVNYGKISLWPIPDSTSPTITIVYQAPFEYAVNSTDTIDFPEEWYLALVYKLAVLLAPDWGIPLADRSKLNDEANEYIMAAQSFGVEDGSMFIQPYYNP